MELLVVLQFVTMDLLDLYSGSAVASQLKEALNEKQARVHLSGAAGSATSVIAALIHGDNPYRTHLHIASSKEEAYYLLNDIETLLGDSEADIDHKRVMLFPTTYRRPYQIEEVDNANVLQRSEVIKQLNAGRNLVVVTYPEALSEKVVSSKTLTSNTMQVMQGAALSMDFMIDVLREYEFERVDFVVEPGQYAVRGGIIDVFSYDNETPYRIEFFDDSVDSLRAFDPVTQLSVRRYEKISIVPNLSRGRSAESTKQVVEEKVSLLHYLGQDDVVWTQGLLYTIETVDKAYIHAGEEYKQLEGSSPIEHLKPESLYTPAQEFIQELLRCKVVECGNSVYFSKSVEVKMNCEPQPTINKQFDMLMRMLSDYNERSYHCYISITAESQQRRLEKVFSQTPATGTSGEESRPLSVDYLPIPLHRGFIDHDIRLLCFTDHEIFDRYHKYTVRDMRQQRETLTIKDLTELKPGDYVTHIDYGVGRFAGLEKMEVNGRTQEVIRIIYKNNDTLYISIHSLHKISRYVGKEGTEPTLNRLGSNSWQVLKQKTKKQVKDIAKDLIALYAKRKASAGFSFSADNYLQNELEASFMFEDTPDQLKATNEVKKDMESSAPMDRLVCGDVGFGKTEVAIRAAFKACCDSKQVAVLVPNTILAFQHYNTFSERLKGLPVRVDYLNRFRTAKEKKQIYDDVAAGKIDILIGTHAITNKNLKFKDLGLLIIDEEQKFGVSMKEKLRQVKANVDCLTLTATPIPRTLQFSLMGARDLSVIQTPPPNRQPVETELCPFSEEVIRDAIMFEMSRGGQTFFVSNRVENLPEMAGLVQRLVPDAVVAMAHGQMEGKQTEEILMRFLSGEIDVLVATTIVENGLDIPNANTMIVNNAQNFGLSDLHQIRGRVGRSNRKAFCYMMVPSFTVLTPDAQKRLKAIEEFSAIGSGFNLAMRDLDIRGAGNILGAEQSGFISEIGYDMYHKILNEAIQELKETEFKELFAQEAEETGDYVKECTIETDLEVLLPDEYVTNIGERLLLYKELNSLVSDDELEAYSRRLEDRFGPLPDPTKELIATVRLRRMAQQFGIEKLVLKQDKMICHFVSDQESQFFKSEDFMKIIRYAQSNPKTVHLKESTVRLSMVCEDVTSISQAIAMIQEITE